MNFKGFVKLFNHMFPNRQQENWIVLFFLSILVGLYSLICIIGIYLPDGITEAEELYIFVITWVIAPISTILSVPFFAYISAKYLKNDLNSLLVFLSINSISFGLLITIIQTTWRFTKSFAYLLNLTYFTIIAIPLINFILIFILIFYFSNNKLNKLRNQLAKKQFNFHPQRIFPSILLGFIIAWAKKENLTPLLFTGKSYMGRSPLYQIGIVLILFIIFSLVCFFIISLFEKSFLAKIIKAHINRHLKKLALSDILWLLVILSGGIGLANFIGLYPYYRNHYWIPAYIPLVSLLIGGIISFYHPFLRTWNESLERINYKKWSYLLDGLVIIVIAIACFDPLFAFEPVHQNFYLGPANRILYGGTMLVDTFSQYGNLSILFLAFVFKTGVLPFTYQGFSLLIAILSTAQFIIVYAILCKLFKNRLYAIFILVITLLLGFFDTLGQYQAYPSVGPYRIGLVYLYLAIVLGKNRYPQFKKIWFFIEFCLIGVAFLWSFESFIYFSFTFLGVSLFESFCVPLPFKASVKSFLYRLFMFLLAIFVANIIFIIYTYTKAQAWPNWSIYLELVGFYSTEGKDVTVLIDTWSPWIFPLLICFTSLMIFLYRYIFLKYRGNPVEDRLIFALTFFGIAFYTYYLFRSHPNALFHISTAPIIIFSYWFYKLKNQVSMPVVLRFSSRLVFYSTAITILLASYPSFISKYQSFHTGLTLFSNISTEKLNKEEIQKWLLFEKTQLHAGSGDPQVPEAQLLIEKYMPEKKEIPLFLTDTNTTEILFTTRRIHTFPIGDILQDSKLKSNVLRIMDYPSTLRNGDYLIIQEDPSKYDRVEENHNLYNLNKLFLERICNQFYLNEIESTKNGTLIVRLMPLNNHTQVYCDVLSKISQIY